MLIAPENASVPTQSDPLSSSSIYYTHQIIHALRGGRKLGNEEGKPNNTTKEVYHLYQPLATNPTAAWIISSSFEGPWRNAQRDVSRAPRESYR